MPPDKLLAVISVLGKDQKGVVAQFATFVADRGVNIDHLEQRVVSGLFVMDMLVDLKDMTVSLAPQAEVATVARQEGMLTLREDGLAKVRAGMTSLDEIVRVTA